MGIDTYTISKDGTITLESILLNIIKVGSHKDDTLVAYKARKKCYKICYKSTKRVDYEEYVDRLIIDNYPNEFKKAELGKKIINQYWWLLIGIIPFPVIGGIIALPFLLIRHHKLSKKIHNINCE